MGPILKFKWLMGFFKSMAPQEQTNKGLVTVIFYLSAALKHSHYSQILSDTPSVPDLSDVSDLSLLNVFSPQVSQSVDAIQTEGAQFFGLLPLPSLCDV